MGVHLYEVTIQESDLDATKQMVMWDAPLRWYFQAHKSLFRERGLDFAALYEQGYVWVAGPHKHWPRFPIPHDAKPIVVSRIEELLVEDVRFVQAVKVGEGAALRSDVVLTLLKDGKPIEIPTHMRRKLES